MDVFKVSLKVLSDLQGALTHTQKLKTQKCESLYCIHQEEQIIFCDLHCVIRSMSYIPFLFLKLLRYVEMFAYNGGGGGASCQVLPKTEM